MNIKSPQISFTNQLVNHFYVGIAITLFYIWVGPKFITAGFPGLSVLLLAEVAILLPLVLGHLVWSSRSSTIPQKLKWDRLW